MNLGYIARAGVTSLCGSRRSGPRCRGKRTHTWAVARDCTSALFHILFFLFMRGCIPIDVVQEGQEFIVRGKKPMLLLF